MPSDELKTIIFPPLFLKRIRAAEIALNILFESLYLLFEKNEGILSNVERIL